ncbi:hypothetical protein MPNB_1381 [Mycoplasmoides pneumoniae]|nr:hypothetical protein MPNB_1381 [Mycoplasmoides pneumoniae]BAV20360.1 hypothetical protein MPNC_1381 [Mycoplasmoides pneumoniae]
MAKLLLVFLFIWNFLQFCWHFSISRSIYLVEEQNANLLFFKLISKWSDPCWQLSCK